MATIYTIGRRNRYVIAFMIAQGIIIVLSMVLLTMSLFGTIYDENNIVQMIHRAW